MEEEGKCGLWATTSKKGTKYYKGKIIINGERYYVSLLLSNKKTNNAPDFNLMITKPFTNSQQEEKEETTNMYQPLVFNEPIKEGTKINNFETVDTPNVYIEDFNLSEDDLPF